MIGVKQIALVFIGGGLGSVLRFAVSKFLNQSTGFPYGTFLVNVLGSLLLGIALGYAMKNNSISSGGTLLVATGFCGGFTTFSTFIFESQALFRSGNWWYFGLYTIGSFALAMIFVLLGLWLAKFF